MKVEGNDITRGHLDKSTLVELRISLITGTYTTVTPIIDHAKLFWWSCGQNEQQADLQETFHSSSITQELGEYL
jgi:hypothetical protein